MHNYLRVDACDPANIIVKIKKNVNEKHWRDIIL